MNTNHLDARALTQPGGAFDSLSNGLAQSLDAYFQRQRDDRNGDRELRREERAKRRQQLTDSLARVERYGEGGMPSAEGSGYLLPEDQATLAAAKELHARMQARQATADKRLMDADAENAAWRKAQMDNLKADNDREGMRVMSQEAGHWADRAGAVAKYLTGGNAKATGGVNRWELKNLGGDYGEPNWVLVNEATGEVKPYPGQAGVSPASIKESSDAQDPRTEPVSRPASVGERDTTWDILRRDRPEDILPAWLSRPYQWVADAGTSFGKSLDAQKQKDEQRQRDVLAYVDQQRKTAETKRAKLAAALDAALPMNGISVPAQIQPDAIRQVPIGTRQAMALERIGVPAAKVYTMQDVQRLADAAGISPASVAQSLQSRGHTIAGAP